MVAGDQLDMGNRGRIVLGVGAGKGRVGDDGGAQAILGVHIGPSHPFVDHFCKGHRGLPADVHPDLHEGDHNAGILTDRPMPLRAHPAVGQDLRNRILCRRSFLKLVGPAQRPDIVHRVIIGDELQRIGH